MCNLYSQMRGQAAIRAAARALADRTGNLPPMPGIFPDYATPFVRNDPDGRELVVARWGMPSPRHALEGKRMDPGVTNIRNTRVHEDLGTTDVPSLLALGPASNWT